MEQVAASAASAEDGQEYFSTLQKGGLFGNEDGGQFYQSPQHNPSKYSYFQWPSQEEFDQMIVDDPDVKMKSLQVFRSEDELDMEGLRVTLTNEKTSPDTLGVSLDSDLHTSIDLTDKQVKQIHMQKAVEFKAPVGFRLKIANDSPVDIVNELFSEEPEGTFEEVPYFNLKEG